VTAWFTLADASRRSHRNGTRAPRSAALRVGHDRSWTGRARTSRATDSGLPHVVIAGTRRTRVSEMRGAAAAGPRRPGAPDGPVATNRAIVQRGSLASALRVHPYGDRRSVG
jgi:hypothetical protein